MGERSNADGDGDEGMDMDVYKDKDEDMDEEEDRDDDGKKMVGQLGLTDASCQRPWREGNPPAGKGDDINFDMIVIFCHQPLTSCYCKTYLRQGTDYAAFQYRAPSFTF